MKYRLVKGDCKLIEACFDRFCAEHRRKTEAVSVWRAEVSNVAAKEIEDLHRNGRAYGFEAIKAAVRAYLDEEYTTDRVTCDLLKVTNVETSTPAMAWA